jgi:hypothetical protein
MNQQERTTIKNVIQRLESARLKAPKTVIYGAGRVTTDVSGQLLDVIRDLESLLPEADREVADGT